MQMPRVSRSSVIRDRADKLLRHAESARNLGNIVEAESYEAKAKELLEKNEPSLYDEVDQIVIDFLKQRQQEQEFLLHQKEVERIAKLAQTITIEEKIRQVAIFIMIASMTAFAISLF